MLALAIYLCDCAGSSLWFAGFSLVAAYVAFSSCAVWPLEHLGSVAVAPEPSYCVACGVLVSRPGIEPTSPALEDWFLTTGPQGNPHRLVLKGF